MKTDITKLSNKDLLEYTQMASECCKSYERQNVINVGTVYYQDSNKKLNEFMSIYKQLIEEISRRLNEL